MTTDRQKIDYAKSYLRRKNTGANTIVGPLTVDKYYRLTSLGAGDDFTNVGASAVSLDHAGEIFKATGITPTDWSHGSILNEIKIDDLKTLADTTFAAATDTITLTSGAFEGGSGTGEITFEKASLGIAIEELLQELDPSYFTAAPIPRRELGVTVRLGC